MTLLSRNLWHVQWLFANPLFISSPVEYRMPPEAEGSVTNFFRQLQSGDRDAAGELWRQFFPRMVGLARKTLQNRPQGMADAEDAAQSALISFWQRAERGDFIDAMDDNQLWNLLATITRRKSLKQIRHEMAQKRGGGHVTNETDLVGAGDEDMRIDQTFAAVPTGDFDVYCEELMLALPGTARGIALMRLAGYLDREIAEILECTVRKVQRKLQLVRRIWTEYMAE